MCVSQCVRGYLRLKKESRVIDTCWAVLWCGGLHNLAEVEAGGMGWDGCVVGHMLMFIFVIFISPS